MNISFSNEKKLTSSALSKMLDRKGNIRAYISFPVSGFTPWRES
jgi:hypothetical protein